MNPLCNSNNKYYTHTHSRIKKKYMILFIIDYSYYNILFYTNS